MAHFRPDVRALRSLHRHVLLSVTSFTWANMTSTHRLYLRNKHIMIDLGTGNNNKMYVLWHCGDPRLLTPSLILAIGQWITNRRSVLCN